MQPTTPSTTRLRNVLFLPTSREQKYKAKQVIDSFFVRAGRRPICGPGLCGCHHPGTERDRFRPGERGACGSVGVIAVAIGREYQRKSRAQQPAAFIR